MNASPVGSPEGSRPVRRASVPATVVRTGTKSLCSIKSLLKGRYPGPAGRWSSPAKPASSSSGWESTRRTAFLGNPAGHRAAQECLARVGDLRAGKRRGVAAAAVPDVGLVEDEGGVPYRAASALRVVTSCPGVASSPHLELPAGPGRDPIPRAIGAVDVTWTIASTGDPAAMLIATSQQRI